VFPYQQLLLKGKFKVSRSGGDGKARLHCLVFEMAMFIESLRLVLSLDLIARMRCTVHICAPVCSKQQDAKDATSKKHDNEKAHISSGGTYFRPRYTGILE